MSQKSEKYMRRMEGQVAKAACVTQSLRGEVRDMEELVWKLMRMQKHTHKQNERLLAAVHANRREQRRKELSHERIAMLICATALFSLLVWVSLEIFKMV